MKKLMAANWKMYKTTDQAWTTAQELVQALDALPGDREVLVFPPFTAISAVVDTFKGHDGYSVGGQNIYPAEEGAFTGEIAPNMLLNLGCSHVLAGHSERRHILGETNEFVGQKVTLGLDRGLKVVLCVGELIEEREAGKVEQVLEEQLKAGLANVAPDVSPELLAVAYEPVWAIGTGKVAGPPEILEAHAFVRKKLIEILPVSGKEIRILYGGSVKPDNCGTIISLDNVDGVLVGGASLHAESFSRIVLA